jgi:hypothetical protein
VLAELLVHRLNVVDPVGILGGWTPGSELGLFRPASTRSSDSTTPNSRRRPSPR